MFLKKVDRTDLRKYPLRLYEYSVVDRNIIDPFYT